MQLKDVMTRDVEIVQPDTTLQEAAARMRARDIGALPDCDGDRLVGIVTDLDISVRATASGADLKNPFVRTVMTPYPLASRIKP
jgi:CBS domain-containing protein